MPTWLDRTIDIVNRLNTYQTAQDLPQRDYEIVEVDTKQIPESQFNYITQDQFDSVEYDSQHLWALYLDGAPAPFDKWFPAQSVGEPSHGASVSSQSFAIEEINMLNSYNVIQMRVEMLDDANGTLESWLKKWQVDISDNYNGFKYPADTCKLLRVYKYNWQKIKQYGRAYAVIPVGDFDLQRNNDPSLKVLTVNFASFGMKPLD